MNEDIHTENNTPVATPNTPTPDDKDRVQPFKQIWGDKP